MDGFRGEVIIATGVFEGGGAELAALVEAGPTYPEEA